MAERLGESTWSDFTKKRKLDLDDKALLKALAASEKTDESKPEARLAALDEVVEQIKKQTIALARRKKELGDKPFGEAKAKLDALLDAAERQQKEAREARAAEGDEEADSPALLTSKMIALVRELRKGEARMHALIGTAGANTAVLIMRRPISPARRKLLGEALDAKGGAKYIPAECLFEDNALTFVAKAKAAGLAKRLKAALLQQTDLRLKVRVRGEAPGDVDEDGEDGEDGGQAQEGRPAAAPKPPPGAATPEALAYTQRLRKSSARLEEALRAQHPESTKLRAVSGFAGEKAAAGDYAAAIKALQTLEKLLDAPVGSPSSGTADDEGEAFKARLAALVPRIKEAVAAGRPGAQDVKLKASEAGTLARQGRFAAAQSLLDEVDARLSDTQPQASAESTRVASPSTEVPAGLVACRKALLAWDTAKKTARADIRKLRDQLLQRHPQQAAAAEALDTALDAFNAGLSARIDDAISAAGGDRRRKHQSAALKIARNYRDFLERDDLILDIDDNPLGVTVDAGKTLLDALDDVVRHLEAAQDTPEA